MARTLFSYDPSFRAPRGGPIIDIQNGLARVGDFPLSIDGVFATQTTQAVRLWQAKSGVPQTGIVDDLTWLGLTQTSMPQLFRRCLSLTAAFEGQGYTLAVGNFDGAGLTWGIIGFTLVTGDLSKVLTTINARAPAAMQAAFGDKLSELLAILGKPKLAKLAWADGISSGPSNATLRADWHDAFWTLGNNPVARQVQDEVARNSYWTRAVTDLKTYGSMTERDAAIFFDAAVQTGGVNSARAAAIKTELAALPAGAGDDQRLSAIARGLTAGVNPTYRADVASRRQAIATGEGVVHGAAYKVEQWAIGLLGVTAADLL